MVIKSISNNSVEELAQSAYSTLVKNQTITLFVNRARSLEIRTKMDGMLMINREKLNLFLSNVAPKTETAPYYFSSSNGDTCYVNFEVVNRFMDLAKSDLPTLKIHQLYAIIDTESDTELVSTDLCQKFALAPKDHLSVHFKTKALVAKLIQNK